MRVDFPASIFVVSNGGNQIVSQPETEYRALLRNLRQELTGTWGYTTNLIPTRVTKYDKDNFESGLVQRGYMIFKDECDLLHIRLKYDKNFKNASMWPEGLTFNIHEFVEDDT